ncbi:hypothetical protein QBC45DRAFT_327639, partial [Copromyces sp. CBS 386.78]
SLYTTSINYTNRKLINASIYLPNYNFKIYYIPSKFNFVPNIFNRLKAIKNAGNPDGISVLDDI